MAQIVAVWRGQGARAPRFQGFVLQIGASNQGWDQFSRVTHKLNCNIAMSSFQLSILIRPSWSATVSFLCGTPNLSALRLACSTTDSSSNPTCCGQLCWPRGRGEAMQSLAGASG
jgi:hypothetical protein